MTFTGRVRRRTPPVIEWRAFTGATFWISAAVAGESRTWREIVHPGPHYLHAAAFDAARGRMVVFSGLISNAHDVDRYEWDGASWERVFTGGPPLRDGHALAYDSRQQRVLLFGGVESGRLIYFGDTWSWDGVS